MMPFMAWQTIFKKQFLQKNKLYFKEGILHEDIEFSVKAFSVCQTCNILSLNLYHYRVNREGSIMSEMSKNMERSLSSYIEIEKSWKQFIGERKMPVENFYIPLAFISQLIVFNYCYPEIKKDLSWKSRFNLYKNIIKGGKNPILRLLLYTTTPRRIFNKRFPGYHASH